MKEEMQIAVIEQLPKITEKIEKVGADLDKRLADLKPENYSEAYNLAKEALNG